jgi:hypothetical protein
MMSQTTLTSVKFIFHTRSKYSKYEKSMMVLDAAADAIETYQPLNPKSGFRVIMGETYRDNLKGIEANKTCRPRS